MNNFQEAPLKNYKTIIVGRSGVGKSALLIRFVDAQFNNKGPATPGIDYRFQRVHYEDKEFNLQLWDTAGQERFRTIVVNYFSLSKAAVAVFDLTDERSLNDSKMWLQQLISHCGNEIPKILLGNKSDLLTPQDLEKTLERYRETIQELKQEYNCQFFAVSAKTGENVKQALDYLVSKIYQMNKGVLKETEKPTRIKLKSSLMAQSMLECQNNSRCC